MTDETEAAADPDANNAAQSYSITFVNESSNEKEFMIFVRIRSPTDLAWFAEPVRVGANRKVEWRETFGFVWGKMPKPDSGGVFIAEETVPASVDYNNNIEFTRQGSDFLFQNANDKGQKGDLTIRTTGLVPSGMVAIGLSMQNAPIIVLEADPNMTYLMAVGALEYWIAAGHYIHDGIVNMKVIGDKCRVKFPPNIFAVKATLEANGTWTLENEIG